MYLRVSVLSLSYLLVCIESLILLHRDLRSIEMVHFLGQGAGDAIEAAQRAEGGWMVQGAYAYTTSNDDIETDLRATLEGYRAAFERKSVQALAEYYVEFTDAHREALARYFNNADDLQVEFTDVRIAIIGDRAALSFTRRDRFVDHQTHETQQVVARLTKLFVRSAVGWQVVPEQQ